MPVLCYGWALLKVIFYLESTKNRTKLLLDPTEKAPRPFEATFLLQVEFHFFLNKMMVAMVMYANISVNVHYIQIAVMKYVNHSILCLQAGP